MCQSLPFTLQQCGQTAGDLNPHGSFRHTWAAKIFKIVVALSASDPPLGLVFHLNLGNPRVSFPLSLCRLFGRRKELVRGSWASFIESGVTR